MDLTSVFGMIFDVDIVDQIKSDSLFSTGVSDRCEKHLAITKSECQEKQKDRYFAYNHIRFCRKLYDVTVSLESTDSAVYQVRSDSKEVYRYTGLVGTYAMYVCSDTN